MAKQVTNIVSLRYLEKSTVLTVFLNNCKDLKSTMLAGRSFHTFTTLMLKEGRPCSAVAKEFVQLVGVTSSACII